MMVHVLVRMVAGLVPVAIALFPSVVRAQEPAPAAVEEEAEAAEEARIESAVFLVSIVTQVTAAREDGEDYDTTTTKSRYVMVRDVEERKATMRVVFRMEDPEVELTAGGKTEEMSVETLPASMVVLDASGTVLESANMPEGFATLLQVPFLAGGGPPDAGSVEDQVEIPGEGAMPPMTLHRRLTTTAGSDGLAVVNLWMEGGAECTVEGQKCDVVCEGRGHARLGAENGDLDSLTLTVTTSVGADGVLITEQQVTYKVRKAD